MDKKVATWLGSSVLLAWVIVIGLNIAAQDRPWDSVKAWFGFSVYPTPELWTVELDLKPKAKAPIPKELGNWQYVKIRSDSDNSWIAWREIEFYAGAEKARPCAAYSSGTYEDFTQPPGLSGGVEKAIDGNPETAWNSGSSSAGLSFIFCGMPRITDVRLLPYGDPKTPIRAEHRISLDSGGIMRTDGRVETPANVWIDKRVWRRPPGRKGGD